MLSLGRIPLLIAEEQDVQVDRSGTVGHVARSSHAVLDLGQGGHELIGPKRGRHERDRVRVRLLAPVAPGLALVGTRDLHNVGPVYLGDLVDASR